MNFSIIIFCYNEVESLPALIESCITVLSPVLQSLEIIIVDDGSYDGTSKVAEQSVILYPDNVRVIRHQENLGIGMALRTGYLQAQGEYICAIPGDGQFSVSQLLFIKPFANNTYYSFYRTETNYNAYRKLLTWINRLFNQHLLGVYLRDVNWIKVYKKEQLEMVKPELKSSLVESEICAKLYKCGVMPVEIPSEYLHRTSGISRGGGWKTLRKAIAETWKLFWVVKKF
jgi:glycosyltransferase involved in cell wall biosynthesis